MALDVANLKAVVFDYGSTLIEFGHTQIHACDSALAKVLTDLYGPPDYDHLHTIRNRDRRAPYTGDFAENDLAAISANLVQELYGRSPTTAELDRILHVRFESFVEAIELEDYVVPCLNRLRERYRLGLLSNYPDGAAIRRSLEKIGLSGHFDAVLVSGEVGRVKPHALPFRTILDTLSVAPHEAVYVGDNWLGDIQGAKRVGMQAAWIVQWNSPEQFDRQPGDAEADLVLHHLTDLLDAVLSDNIPAGDKNA